MQIILYKFVDIDEHIYNNTKFISMLKFLKNTAFSFHFKGAFHFMSLFHLVNNLGFASTTSPESDPGRIRYQPV